MSSQLWRLRSWRPALAGPEALFGILLLAAVVRFWGLGYGLPHPLTRPDEEIVVGHALELSLGRIDDRASYLYADLLYFRDPVRGRAIPAAAAFAFPYPNLVYDMNAAVFAVWRKAGQWTGAFADDLAFVEHLAVGRPGAAYTAARAVTALCGTATVLATFAAALWAFNRRPVALLAALLVAVNFLHARDSHYATVDVPMTLMVTLALAFAAKAIRSGARKDVLWSACFVGLAASAKFNGAAVALATTYAAARRFFDRPSVRDRKWIVVTLILAGLVAIAVFAVTSPWCIRYAKTVHLGLRIQRRMLFGTPGTPGAFVFLTDTLPGAFGWIGFGAALAGVARACWKRRTGDLVLLAFLVPAFAAMAGITWVLPRYPLPLIPVLAIFAADASLARSARWPAWNVAVVVALLALPPLAQIVQYDRVAGRADTRVLASAWIGAHVPAGARVAVCRGYGAPIVNTDDRRPPAFDRVQLLPCNAETIQKANAQFVVTAAHPVISYFAPTEDGQRWLEAHARPIGVFSPFRDDDRQLQTTSDSSGRQSSVPDDVRQCFYAGDAFYLPYCGFSGVERGGPVVTVWALTP